MDSVQLVPGPLEQYCQLFDQTFTRPTQRATLRTYLQGLLLGLERHKTATGLANTEPGKDGSQHKDAQRLQWFLSESTWDPERLNDTRLAMLRTITSTAPSHGAVLVIDETGDRKYGTHTAQAELHDSVECRVGRKAISHYLLGCPPPVCHTHSD